MSDSNKSYEDGRYGRSSHGAADWSSYQAGRAEKDAWDKHRAAMNAPASSSSLPSWGGGGGTGGGPSTGPADAAWILALMGLVLGVVGFQLLYPLAVGSAVASWYYLGDWLVGQAWAARWGVATYLPIALGAVVLVAGSRLEHRAGRSLFYRVPRHALRLAVIGAATLLVLRVTPWPINFFPQTWEQVPGWAKYYAPPLAVIAAVMVLAHLVLWHWRGLRGWWHEKLESLRLRPR
jgi:hypothetical protein